MRAIILGPPENGSFKSHDHVPSCLLWLGDRPFLQHVIESLVPRGITQFDFVFADSLRALTRRLGDGSRWGCTFHFHLISRAGIAPLLRELTADINESILLGRADRLPAFDDRIAKGPVSPEGAAFFVKHGMELRSQSTWSGWALFADRASLQAKIVEPEADDSGPDEEWLRIGDQQEQIEYRHELSVESAVHVLRSQKELLNGAFPDLAIGGRKFQDGVWVGRNVSIDPTATLTGPVYIGANSRIAARAHVGPFTVLAEDCMVGLESTIHDALICPSTYVGEGLEIHQAIVNHNHVVDARNGVSYKMTDHFLLGSLVDDRHTYALRQVADRIIAVFLLALFSPILALSFLLSLCESEQVADDDVLRIPGSSEEYAWKTFPLQRFNLASIARWRRMNHFLGVFLPGLMSVVRGDLALVGVPPRSAKEVAKLPDDWRALYLKAKAGLISTSVMISDTQPSHEELRASECYYSVTESFTGDLRIMGQYLLKLSTAGLTSDHNHEPKPAPKLARHISVESRGE